MSRDVRYTLKRTAQPKISKSEAVLHGRALDDAAIEVTGLDRQWAI
jgi:hypothetical protein